MEEHEIISKLKKMEIHDTVNFGQHLSIMKVIGGWLYEITYARGFNIVFVPDPEIEQSIWIKNPGDFAP